MLYIQSRNTVAAAVLPFIVELRLSPGCFCITRFTSYSFRNGSSYGLAVVTVMDSSWEMWT